MQIPKTSVNTCAIPFPLNFVSLPTSKHVDEVVGFM